jgi:hypothetical protein
VNSDFRGTWCPWVSEMNASFRGCEIKNKMGRRYDSLGVRQLRQNGSGEVFMRQVGNSCLKREMTSDPFHFVESR